MSLPLENLDDRRFEDLVEEGRAMIPAFAPDWTNHNISDPGITLLELFAYLAEMLSFRVNQISPSRMSTFLKLLNGSGWQRSSSQSLDDAIDETIRNVRQVDRAVTCADYESLANKIAGVARSFCVPQRNLRSGNPSVTPGHISLVVMPVSNDISPRPSPDLLRKVSAYLEERRLLTTKLHVVGPRYVKIVLYGTVVKQPGISGEALRDQIVRAIRLFLHPINGGADGRGWPAGRDLYISEIYEHIHGIPGVGYILTESLRVEGVGAERLRRNIRGELVSIEVKPGEFIEGVVEPHNIQIQ